MMPKTTPTTSRHWMTASELPTLARLRLEYTGR
jgi:hypothetical protein